MKAQPSLRLERLRAIAWQPWMSAGLAYLLLALLSMAPTLATFARAVPGSAVAQYDGWQNVWNLWWVEYALRNGLNPFYTQMIFYPQGVDLLGQTLTITNGLLLLPVTALFGPVAGYNAAVLLSFVLAGLGGYALTYHVTRHAAAAFVGGCVFSFAPFHMTKVWDGQLELIALQWLPFFVLLLLRALRSDGLWRDALGAGLVLALVGYTSWYYLYFTAIAAVLIVVLWLPYRAGGRVLTMALLRALTAGLIGLLLVAPALLPLFGSALERRGPSASAALLPARSATLLDFFLPSYLHPFWGDWVQQLGAPWHAGVAAWNVALGYLPLVLAGVAVWRLRESAWRWMLLALIACVLALGPRLQIGGWDTGLLLPYAGLSALPGGNLSHRPGHFVVIACVALAPLAGLGLRALSERLHAPQRPWLLAAVLLLLAWEFLPPRWHLWEPLTHPYYQALANEPGALLVLPAQAEDVRPLIDQIRHGLPLMGGLLARTPNYDPPRAPGVGDLWRPDVPPGRLLPADRAQALSALQHYGVGHVVIERSRLTAAEAAALPEVLARLFPATAPIYEDAQLEVYRMPAAAPRPFAFFGAGWHREESQEARSWRWMKANASIVLVNPADRVRKVALLLSLESYQQERTLALALGNASLGTWQIPAQPGRATKLLHFWLPPGEHRLALRSLDGVQFAPDNRDISVVLTDIALRCCAGEE